MDTESEIFIGCCEMETETWACGNMDTLVGTHVRLGPEANSTEYRYVCGECRSKFTASAELLAE